MRFLVDGYNVTRRDPATAALALDAQREALVARLAARGRDLLGAGPVTVVFDGVAGGRGQSRRGQVEVRYSRDESADDLIARLANSAEVTVVTSDGELARRANAVGAHVLGAETCFEGRRARRRGTRYPAASAGIPKGANKVTEELKRIWLADDE